MGFTVVKIIPADAPMVEVDARLCLTEDGRLVAESDPAARWLYCLPGHRVPMDEAIKYGLVEPEPDPKQRQTRANKARTPTEDK